MSSLKILFRRRGFEIGFSMRGICALDDEATSSFLKGDSVGLILYEIDGKQTRYHGMVFNVEEYRDLVASHTYIPLLYRCGIPLRIAYVFGCFPEKYGSSREGRYRVLTRKIGTDDWKTWFIVENLQEDPLL